MEHHDHAHGRGSPASVPGRPQGRGAGSAARRPRPGGFGGPPPWLAERSARWPRLRRPRVRGSGARSGGRHGGRGPGSAGATSARRSSTCSPTGRPGGGSRSTATP